MATPTSSSALRIGTPKKPDEKLYAHLSEKERMLQGWPYKPNEPGLVLERSKSHKLNREFNDSAADDVEGRREIIRKLIHPDSKDKKIYIEPPFRTDYGYNIKVGNNFYANFDCVILDCSPVEFGDDCMLAPGVHIYTATHPLDPEYRKDPNSSSYYELSYGIKIGDNCWIGGRAVICPGVTIGDNVVVGAGAVVTKNIPSNVVVGGNPAKIIRYLDGADIPKDFTK